jgi:hypothetical protein
MDLTDELRYPTVSMTPSNVDESSTYAELEPIANSGIIRWFLTHTDWPSMIINYELTMMGVAFHRGIFAMEKVNTLLHQLGKGNCGPANFPLNHRRCTDPSRPLYTLYIVTRDLDPYLKGVYRLDAFLEQIQHSIWNHLHGISFSDAISAQFESFARTLLPFEKPRLLKGELVFDWLSSALEWLNWIEHFHP